MESGGGTGGDGVIDMETEKGASYPHPHSDGTRAHILVTLSACERHHSAAM